MPDWIDPFWIFALSLFGLAAIAVDAALALFAVTDGRQRINRRLATLDGSGASHAPVARLRRQRASADGWVDLPGRAAMEKLLLQSGVSFGLQSLAAGAVFVSVACAGALSLKLELPAAIGVGIVIGIGLPIAALKFLRARRQRKFGEQFPEAIDILVRSLRAGHPIAAAIKTTARELPEPAGREFMKIEEELTYGLDLETAMRNLQQRVGQEDLPLFVTSISIQTQSGGNLTEILNNLSGTIRQRIKLHRKVRALTSEGRASALILGAVPFVIFGVLNYMAPDFYGSQWGHPWMKIGLTGAAIWMSIGFMTMRKMINFKV
ncbi:MAG: type II secretion system F family protein [Hyphomicrobiales bacterium]|nr:type II secretion system F family protein [Hyphomicrobiales bacterium]